MNPLTFADSDVLLPEPGPIPGSIEQAKMLLLAGGIAAGLLLLICIVRSVRARRVQYSLKGFMAFCLALSVGLLGGVRWYQALALAPINKWVAVIDGDLILTSHLEEHRDSYREIVKRLDAFKAQKIAAGAWNASSEQEWIRISSDSLENALRDTALDWLMLKQARLKGLVADQAEVEKGLSDPILSGVSEFQKNKMRKALGESYQINLFKDKLWANVPPATAMEMERYYKDNPQLFRRTNNPKDKDGPVAFEEVANDLPQMLREANGNKAVEDWQRAALTRAKPMRYVGGKWEPIPLEFFFPK